MQGKTLIAGFIEGTFYLVFSIPPYPEQPEYY